VSPPFSSPFPSLPLRRGPRLARGGPAWPAHGAASPRCPWRPRRSARSAFGHGTWRVRPGPQRHVVQPRAAWRAAGARRGVAWPAATCAEHSQLARVAGLPAVACAHPRRLALARRGLAPARVQPARPRRGPAIAPATRAASSIGDRCLSCLTSPVKAHCSYYYYLLYFIFVL
jgi:hypothetical protein